MTDWLHGPDKPCRRTACVAARQLETQDAREREIAAGADPVDALADPLPKVADHLGGAHLDPHDRERFDGVHISHITYKIRSDLYALLAVKKDHPELAEIIDTAVVKATNEIDFLGQQIAHVRVDADNKVRDAMRRADDCTEHGKMITDLGRQVGYFAKAEERQERARLALLGEHQAIREMIEGYDRMGNLGGGVSVESLEQIIEFIRKTNKRTSAAHDRA